MASEQANGEERTEQSHGPRECMPCRGTGKVISNLGGTPSTVACPWCEGGGERLAGIDAQSKWRSGEDAKVSQPEVSQPQPEVSQRVDGSSAA